jgi:hypothetical protein
MATLAEKEFVASRVKPAGLLAVSVLFVAIAVLLPPAQGAPEVWRFLAGGFFGVCALVFAALIVRPQRIVVDSEGFALHGGLIVSSKKTLWRDTEPFFVCRLANNRKTIGFNYRSGARDRTALLRVNRKLGADGALPILQRGSAEELVEELNAYRQRALS